MPSELITLAKKPLTPKEKELVAEMTKPGVTIDVVVPNDINPKDWAIATGITCRVLLRAQLQEQQLTPVLGRLLSIAESNPEIYDESKHGSFRQFMISEVCEKFGVSISTCYEAKRSAQFTEAAQLKLEDLEQIGRTNMRELVKAVEEGKETTKTAKAIIEKAKLPVSEFRAFLEEKGFAEKGDNQGAYIREGVSKATLNRWQKFKEDPEIQAYVGSGKVDKLLDAMMAYCGPEWKAKQNDSKRAEEVA